MVGTNALGLLRRPRARHASDGIRIVVGLLILALAALPVRADTIGRVETGAFDLVNGLTGLLLPPVYVLMQLGSLLVVPVAVVAAFVIHRRGLALDFALAGTSAWLAAHEFKRLFGRPRPGGLLEVVTIRGQEATGLGFVSGHTAVATALATVASSYLPRRWRWAPPVIAIGVGLSRIYVGAHLPLDVVGGAGLGWAIGAAVHLALGTPTGRPTIEQVSQGFAGLGLPVAQVQAAEVPAAVSAPYRVTLVDGRELFVKAVGELRPDRDVIYRAWRVLARRRTRNPQRFTAPRSQVEHEAAVSLAAERAGIRTPAVVLARSGVGRTALLAFAWSPGETFDVAVASDRDVEPLLVSVWEQVLRLHAAGIAHGLATRDNVLVDVDGEGGVSLVDFGAGVLAATPEQRRADTSEMLVSLSAVIPAEVVIATATAVLGASAVADAVANLGQTWFTDRTRAELAADPGLIGRLEAALAAS